jgi:hypothetical protein
MPVLYERAIECAASERWAAIWAEDEGRWQVLELPSMDFWKTT